MEFVQHPVAQIQNRDMEQKNLGIIEISTWMKWAEPNSQVWYKSNSKNNNSLFDLGESSEATVNRDNILRQISSIFFGSQ